MNSRRLNHLYVNFYAERFCLRTKDDLDLALKNLKALDLQKIKLLPFEQELVEDAQKSL